MKKFKAILAGLMLVMSLSLTVVPTTVRADGGGPQGTSDTRSRQTQSSSEAAARALWAWILSLLK